MIAERQETDYPHYPRPWSHAAKVEYMLLDLAAKGVNPHTAVPPFYRLLWKLGLEVPPPLFLGFAGNLLVMGGFFGVLWSLWMIVWGYFWVGIVEPLAYVVMGLFTGAIFGLIMAGLMKRTAKKLNLPGWRDYPPEHGVAFHQPF